MIESMGASVGPVDELAQRLTPELETGILNFVVLGFARWRDCGFHRFGDYENHFTAALLGCLREVSRQHNLPFRAQREFVIDTPEILAGDANPNAASRLDIAVWWDRLSDDAFYSIECKRLSSGNLCTEYVAEGIMRYATSRYASNKQAAGMAAYIVDGEASQLLGRVNEHIIANARLGASGQLADQGSVGELTTVYRSRHGRSGSLPDIELTHLWFDVRQRPPIGSAVHHDTD
jgi:hypothetical protein